LDTKKKSRPEDNLHCFRGMGRPYWRMRASGFDPVIEKGRDGHFVRYRTEEEAADAERAPNADSFAKQNGGIYSPQETNMNPGVYFRFISSNGGNKFGNWWLETEHYLKVCALAEERSVPLAVAARLCIVIPREWGDCGCLVKARLKKPLHAYVGKGKPATGSVSPDNASRDKETQPVHMAPAHIEMKQWFVPGDSKLLERMFSVERSIEVLKKGKAL